MKEYDKTWRNVQISDLSEGGGQVLSFGFGFLNIKRIIVHEVFVRSENRQVQTPRYNNNLTVLNRDGIAAFQSRIIDALGDNSHSIEMEIVNVSENSTFTIASKMMYDSDAEFIENSKKITNNLADAQTSRNIPGGVVVIFDGTVGEQSNRFLGIIKAEIHGGFSLENENQDQIDLKYLSSLILTPQQKFYKIGMFIEVNQAEDEDIARQVADFRVFVYDHKMNRADRSMAALYFYETFMGCSISSSNKKLTLDFYVYTKDFIKTLDVSDEEKVDLNTALVTYLKTSQSNIISMGDFSEQYFQPDFIDKYCSYMVSKGFPSNAIAKDITYIKSRLQKRKLVFTSNVNIIAPSENFQDLVEITGLEGTKTILKIEGHIRE